MEAAGPNCYPGQPKSCQELKGSKKYPLVTHLLTFCERNREKLLEEKVRPWRSGGMVLFEEKCILTLVKESAPYRSNNSKQVVYSLDVRDMTRVPDSWDLLCIKSSITEIS